MTNRREWGDLPEGVRHAVERKVGAVLTAKSPDAGRGSEFVGDAVNRLWPCVCKGIAADSPSAWMHRNELGEGARTVSLMTLILAGALSTYCRPSAGALAAYEVDPTLVELRLDLRATLENAVATLIAGTLARP